MLELRPHTALGRMDLSWLKARYHFSFANYFDPKRQGLGPLLVWNDDTIQPGSGFPQHGHRDMEIITYVREGAITHRDHLGNEGRTEAGDVQVMSAGTGILHEEYNLESDPTKIFQIWVIPDRQGHKPRWESRAFPKTARQGRLIPLASGQEGVEALTIHQDATLYGATLGAGEEIAQTLGLDRLGYLVVARGAVTVNGERVAAGDGLAIADVETLTLRAEEESEVLLMDVTAFPMN